ncbi:hypothetical protein ACPFUK_003047 [Vibrio cholerae]|uniref:hypothetical protein n=1 Tax=Vibrio cholerae TaxID=666 RepID=UPI0011D87C4D|nr:hypothetical protein [Vibrio cholerae]TXX84632.1 hypothetical protein FXE94_07180 [Vibrio cholerae]GHY54084.1 hypothetical protein VCSRO119_3105 [Vibrio cholerae]GIA62339.1 hypothetical protein VCSRO87_3110 [Vibrio cholerae]
MFYKKVKLISLSFIATISLTNSAFAGDFFLGGELSFGSISGGSHYWNKYIDNDKSSKAIIFGKYYSEKVRLYGFYEKDNRNHFFSYANIGGQGFLDTYRYGLGFDYSVLNSGLNSKLYFPFGLRLFKYSNSGLFESQYIVKDNNINGYGIGFLAGLGYKLTTNLSLETGWKTLYQDDSSHIGQAYLSSNFKF